MSKNPAVGISEEAKL